MKFLQMYNNSSAAVFMEILFQEWGAFWNSFWNILLGDRMWVQSQLQLQQWKESLQEVSC